KDLLQKGIKDHAKEVSLWVALAGLAGREKPAAGLAILKEAEPHVSDRLQLTLAQLQFLLDLPKEESRKELAKVEKRIAGAPEEDRPRLLGALGQAYFHADATEDALRVWRDLAVKQPRHLR